MKIGIFTFHRAHNYGAVLQAYALKTFLVGLGHDVKFIDYWPEYHEKIYKVWNADLYKNKSFIIKLKIFIKFLLLFFKKQKRINVFNNFIYTYLGVDKMIKYRKFDLDDDLGVDLVVYGSDQIWRNWITAKQYIGFDPVYFGFDINPSISKVAYAVSMGIINFNDTEEEFLRKSLTNFSAILVRENKLLDLLGNFDYKSNVVCDPVFLLSKDKWNCILPKERYIKDDYVLYYRLLPSVEAEQLAIDIAKKNNCKLLVVTSSVSLAFSNKEKQTLSPLQFIQVIRDAKFVIATSFHGTAFSLIFEKQFYTLGLGANSDRVQTLLDKLDLADRYINDFDTIKFNEIDYSNITTKFDRMISDAEGLLSNAINIR